MIDRERYLLWTGKYYPNKMCGLCITKIYSDVFQGRLDSSQVLKHLYTLRYMNYFFI